MFRTSQGWVKLWQLCQRRINIQMFEKWQAAGHVFLKYSEVKWGYNVRTNAGVEYRLVQWCSYKYQIRLMFQLTNNSINECLYFRDFVCFDAITGKQFPHKLFWFIKHSFQNKITCSKYYLLFNIFNDVIIEYTIEIKISLQKRDK